MNFQFLANSNIFLVRRTQEFGMRGFEIRHELISAGMRWLTGSLRQCGAAAIVATSWSDHITDRPNVEEASKVLIIPPALSQSELSNVVDYQENMRIHILNEDVPLNQLGLRGNSLNFGDDFSQINCIHNDFNHCLFTIVLSNSLAVTGPAGYCEVSPSLSLQYSKSSFYIHDFFYSAPFLQ